MLWLLAFVAIAAVIFVAASKLSVFADLLAERLHLSRSWLGLLVLSVVTTLPEGATTISAILKVDSPNMALGNNYGSILFNTTIIAFCDLIFRKSRLLRHAKDKNAFPAACAVIMIMLSLLAICFPVPLRALGLRFSFGTVVVLAAFMVLFWWMRRFEMQQLLTEVPGQTTSEMSTMHAVLGFVFAAVVVVLCGIGLAVTGKNIAQHLGLTHSFVGMLFMAFATSLPELTVGISAVRIGAYDLMLGNVMGANMLNILVVAVADIVYRKDVLAVPKNLGRENVFAGLMSVVAISIVIIGIISVPKARRKLPVDPTSIAMLALYVGTIAVIFFGHAFFAG